MTQLYLTAYHLSKFHTHTTGMTQILDAFCKVESAMRWSTRPAAFNQRRQSKQRITRYKSIPGGYEVRIRPVNDLVAYDKHCCGSAVMPAVQRQPLVRPVQEVSFRNSVHNIACTLWIRKTS